MFARDPMRTWTSSRSFVGCQGRRKRGLGAAYLGVVWEIFKEITLLSHLLNRGIFQRLLVGFSVSHREDDPGAAALRSTVPVESGSRNDIQNLGRTSWVLLL